MERHHRRRLLTAALSSMLTVAAGCAAPASSGGMRVADRRAPAAAGALRGQVTLLPVQGGRATNRYLGSHISGQDFEDALRTSLGGAGYLASSAEPRFSLQAEILEAQVVDENPSFVVLDRDQTVTSTIHYVLTDTRGGAVLLDRRIEVPYTASQKSAFTTSQRTRLANEGSARESIDTLLDELAAVRVPEDGSDSQ